MMVLVVLLIVLLPAVAIAYPFVRRRGGAPALADESSPQAELSRRWEAALTGLESAELERAIGTLAEDDYQTLREQYMEEAAVVLKALELEQQEEAEFMAQIQREVRRVRQQTSRGPKAASGEGPSDA